MELDGLTPRRDRRRYQAKSASCGGLDRAVRAPDGRQHLGYWARLALIPAAERSAKIAAALARFELEEIAGRRASRLSMGQRQRLTLALTFMHDPTLVLFDEPWNSLDGAGRGAPEHRHRGLRRERRQRAFCVPSGHALEDVPVDRVYVLADGTLEAE